MKISRFRVELKNREIKRPQKMHFELKIVIAGNREIQMHKKISFFAKKIN